MGACLDNAVLGSRLESETVGVEYEFKVLQVIRGFRFAVQGLGLRG